MSRLCEYMGVNHIVVFELLLIINFVVTTEIKSAENDNNDELY